MGVEEVVVLEILLKGRDQEPPKPGGAIDG
jgi:hypothetical protein